MIVELLGSNRRDLRQSLSNQEKLHGVRRALLPRLRREHDAKALRGGVLRVPTSRLDLVLPPRAFGQQSGQLLGGKRRELWPREDQGPRSHRMQGEPIEKSSSTYSEMASMICPHL